MDIIKALKENEKPFGLMSKEMQEKAKEIGKTDFEYYKSDCGWVGTTSIEWHNEVTYRLRPDYEETPDVVKCYLISDCDREVETFEYNGNTYDLHEASSLFNFIGFLYEDGYVRPVARCYKLGKGSNPVYRMYEKNVGQYEVLTPTHVLFRGAK